MPGATRSTVNWAQRRSGAAAQRIGRSTTVRSRIRPLRLPEGRSSGRRVVDGSGRPATFSGMSIHRNVLGSIGNTSLVRLQRVVPPGCARIVVKVEGENPTGSMKDRMAQAMVARAEGDGRLKPGDTIVDYTGGSTGASLALVAVAKGYRIKLVTSTAFSEEKLTQMIALGAELVLVESEGGKFTKKLFLEMIATAKTLSTAPHHYWTDQLTNADSIAGYHRMGQEIWDQTEGRVDAFVQSVGTSASLRGVASVLRRLKPGIRIIAVEPAESAVLSGGAPGAL